MNEQTEQEKQLLSTQYKIFKRQIEYLVKICGEYSSSTKSSPFDIVEKSVDIKTEYNKYLPFVELDEFENALLPTIGNNGGINNPQSATALLTLLETYKVSFSQKSLTITILKKTRLPSVVNFFLSNGGFQILLKWLQLSEIAIGNVIDISFLQHFFEWLSCQTEHFNDIKIANSLRAVFTEIQPIVATKPPGKYTYSVGFDHFPKNSRGDDTSGVAEIVRGSVRGMIHHISNYLSKHFPAPDQSGTPAPSSSLAHSATQLKDGIGSAASKHQMKSAEIVTLPKPLPKPLPKDKDRDALGPPPVSRKGETAQRGTISSTPKISVASSSSTESILNKYLSSTTPTNTNTATTTRVEKDIKRDKVPPAANVPPKPLSQSASTPQPVPPPPAGVPLISLKKIERPSVNVDKGFSAKQLAQRSRTSGDTEQDASSTTDIVSPVTVKKTQFKDFKTFMGATSMPEVESVAKASTGRKIKWSDEVDGGSISSILLFDVVDPMYSSDVVEIVEGGDGGGETVEETDGGGGASAGEVVQSGEEKDLEELLPHDHKLRVAMLSKRERESEKINLKRSVEEAEFELQQLGAKMAPAIKKFPTPAKLNVVNRSEETFYSKEKKLQSARLAKKFEVVYAKFNDIPEDAEAPPASTRVASHDVIIIPWGEDVVEEAVKRPKIDERSVVPSDDKKDETDSLAPPCPATRTPTRVDVDSSSGEEYSEEEEGEEREVEGVGRAKDAEEGNNDALDLLPDYVKLLSEEHLAILIEKLSDDAYSHLIANPDDPQFMELVEHIAPGTKRRYYAKKRMGHGPVGSDSIGSGSGGGRGGDSKRGRYGNDTAEPYFNRSRDGAPKHFVPNNYQPSHVAASYGSTYSMMTSHATPSAPSHYQSQPHQRYPPPSKKRGYRDSVEEDDGPSYYGPSR